MMLHRRSLVLLITVLLFVFAGPAQAADSIKIIINKKVNRLAYFKNGVVIKEFPVATGRQPTYTPEGDFKVVRKLVRPYYSKLKIPGRSPNNPLGERWLGLDALGTSGGTYGVHGTNAPSSIGKYASSGCIRMYNQDVIWLYNNTPLNTPVSIINEAWDIYQRPVTILVNGLVLPEGKKSNAFMKGNTVMVSCRVLAEALGWDIAWEPTERKVTVSGGGRILSIRVDSTNLSVNGEQQQMLVPAVLQGGTVYVHVRPMVEPFGYQPVWDGTASSVNLIPNISTSNN